MRLRATITVGLATLCMLLFGSVLGSTAADAYPATTCSALAVSTTNPAPGEAFTVSGSNFLPNSSVGLELTPGNTPLKTVTSNGSGAFSTQVTLPDSATNAGHFDIVATSGAINNNSCSADPFQNLAIQAETNTNTGSSNGSGGLSVTGLDVAGLLALAAGLLGAGLLLNRKRTKVGSR